MADESLILNDKGVAGLLDPDSAQDQKERLESMERRLWAAAETFSGQPIELILRPTQPRCPNAHRYVNGVKQPCPDCTTGKQGEGDEIEREAQRLRALPGTETSAVDVGGGPDPFLTIRPPCTCGCADNEIRPNLMDEECDVAAPQPSHVEGHSCSNCEGDPASCFGSQHPDIQGLEEELEERADQADRWYDGSKTASGKAHSAGLSGAFRICIGLVREHFSREGER